MTALAAPSSTTGELSQQDLRDIESVAVELARVAADEIQSAFGGLLTVKYKDAPAAQMAWQDPVSEVDDRVEKMIRARLAERFPSHDVLGEESTERPGRDHDVVWAVDPIDGTTNFVNGFPLFAASIGVLYRGRPMVGALWCATSHALRAGVYHARRGGALCFEGEAIEPRPNPAVRRRLAGLPHVRPDVQLPWQARITGSAALECAFVAAGLMHAAYFERPNVWDIAGGIMLVEAAGGDVQMRTNGTWTALRRFEPAVPARGEPADLRHWHRPTIIGEAGAVAQLVQLHQV
jgi:myo-inositol-1(or 4)-monophosphatase